MNQNYIFAAQKMMRLTGGAAEVKWLLSAFQINWILPMQRELLEASRELAVSAGLWRYSPLLTCLPSQLPSGCCFPKSFLTLISAHLESPWIINGGIFSPPEIIFQKRRLSLNTARETQIVQRHLRGEGRALLVSVWLLWWAWRCWV